MSLKSSYIRFFEDLSMADVPIVGGKNASLGEMVRELGSQGVRVPGGFAVTSQAYWEFVSFNGLRKVMEAELEGLDTQNMPALQLAGKRLREAFLAGGWPPDLAESIEEAYDKLCQKEGLDSISVAVRSSATAEDLPQASFAGQQETYLNIHGKAALLESVRRCFASLFTDRAIHYRVEQGFQHLEVALSVGVQRMVRSDLSSSGVMFSVDTESGNPDIVLITGAWGLGETVVQGAVVPDEFLIHKPTLEQGFKAVVGKTLGPKAIRMVYNSKGTGAKTESTPRPLQRKWTLTDEEALVLGRWAIIIEKHYSQVHGKHTPMDMEWAKDGETNELFIVQARPETVVSQQGAVVETWALKEKGNLLLSGTAVGHKIAQGKARVLTSPSEMHLIEPGDVLVADRTDPDWEPVMKVASAIVTNRGGRTCHAAIISREMGIPAIVGAENATKKLNKPGLEVTVSCSEGEQGNVYEGLLGFERNERVLADLPTTQTKIMLILSNPDQALGLGQLPFDGVGLARMEFIINHSIGIHPNALLDFDQLKEGEVKEQIAERTLGYKEKSEFFVDQLALGLAKMAAGFYPRQVILRLSDFKSNEYRNLLGGDLYEPVEENPMLGLRGASRYQHPHFIDAFKLECLAIRRVREEQGLHNLKLMVPFCRTVAEARTVLEVMARLGLERGKDGLEIYMMCEIPSNVLLMDRFAELFDGFSIGSNDLTQLTLGVDRDSAEVAGLFDERNEAMSRFFRMAIAGAHQAGRVIGICGQAPSDYPEVAQLLVEEGIDSISLNPDSAFQMRQVISEVEAQ